MLVMAMACKCLVCRRSLDYTRNIEKYNLQEYLMWDYQENLIEQAQKQKQ